VEYGVIIATGGIYLEERSFWYLFAVVKFWDLEFGWEGKGDIIFVLEN